MTYYKRLIFSAISLILFINGSPLLGSELIFPENEAEIVKALSHQDTTEVSISGTVKYVLEKGKVFKIINNKRFRLRGIEVAEAMEVLPKVGALIHFDFDSAKIRNESFQLLDEYGSALKGGLSAAVLMVVGHTDSKGSNDYNQTLSIERAKAVADYLSTKFNFDPRRLIIQGKGESQPLLENINEANRSKNRRVEFVRIE